MATAKAKKMKAKQGELIKAKWPELEGWDWTRESNGFTSIPRVLCLVATIAETLKDKSKSVSSTYIGLWCRTWDCGLVDISSENEMATEAGFTGEKRAYSWRDRIKQLEKLGFLRVASGPKGDYQYIFIINPYFAVAELRAKGKIQDAFWDAIKERAHEIGADAFEVYDKKMEVAAKLKTVLKNPSKKKVAK